MIIFFQLNPFDLAGPTFLVVYITALAAACFIAYVLRKRASGSDYEPQRPFLRSDQEPAFRSVNLDAYEAAYLRGGSKLAIETAIATLVRSNALHLSFVDNSLSPVPGAPRPTHPFEQEVHRVIQSGEANKINTIRTNASAAAERLASRLRALGLILSDQGMTTAHLVPVIIMLLVLAFGAIKILVGLWRDRPVGFLFVLCCLTAFIAYRLFKSPPLRTAYGDQILERLKYENAALEATARSKPEGLATGDVSLAIALFGMTALAFTDQSWSMLRREMIPPVSVSRGSSSCSTSSCSSSSSCGSSGCGGGCGGGGCGGCGS